MALLLLRQLAFASGRQSLLFLERGLQRRAARGRFLQGDGLRRLGRRGGRLLELLEGLAQRGVLGFQIAARRGVTRRFAF